jgi:GNAT superfamily N-acetyltransferase
MNIPLTYRKASIKDFVGLKELGIASYLQFSQVLTEENWEKLYNGLSNDESLWELINKSTVFICETGEKITGVAYFVPSGNPSEIFQAEWCYLRRVGVDPQYRGFGIARNLTLLCIEHARETKEKVLKLHTSEFMDAARHIYESLGFKKEKELNLIFGKRYWLYTLNI